MKANNFCCGCFPTDHFSVCVCECVFLLTRVSAVRCSPDGFYDVMLQCWKGNPKSRKDFTYCKNTLEVRCPFG